MIPLPHSQTLSDEQDLKRMSFNIPVELYDRLKETIPWGNRGHFLERLLEIALNSVEKGGYEIIGAIYAGDYDPLFRKGE